MNDISPRPLPVRRRLLCDPASWDQVDEAAMPDKVRLPFLARKKAVLMYMSDAAAKDIKSATGIGERYVARLIRERCLAVSDDGRIYGWEGLLRYKHLKPYTRTQKINVDRFGQGAAGAFKTVLAAHPAIQAGLDKRILATGSEKKLGAAKFTALSNCRWFLNQLRELGFEERGEWPFNTKGLGYWAIVRYGAFLRDTSPKALAYANGGADAVKKLKTGDGVDRPVLGFLDRVEMDAHKLDGIFCVSIPSPDGDVRERIVHRVQVIVLLDVCSRAVLGYHLSLAREVSKDDVLRAIKSAFLPWKRRDLKFSDQGYVAGAGLLSTLGNDFERLCWNETSVDGALAGTCATVRQLLKEVIGSTLTEPRSSFSSRRSKDDRPFIESFFGKLGAQGFQKMSNTTGGNTGDRKGRTPDKVAINSKFAIEWAEEILDVLVANYNATPHTSHSGDRSPLAQAKFLYSRDPDSFRKLPDVTNALMCFSARKLCKVKGGGETGRLPYVQYYHARYTNELLQNRLDLFGKEIWVVNHLEDDARVAMASTVEGLSLGILRAAPPWHGYPHSLAVRCEIKRLSGRLNFMLQAGADGVETFLDFVDAQPQSKLPVYPAYLEARRILAIAAQASESLALRSEALKSGMETRSGEEMAQGKSESIDILTPTTHEPDGRKDAIPEPARRATATVGRALPPPRKAVSR